jgi:hypothetical protein
VDLAELFYFSGIHRSPEEQPSAKTGAALQHSLYPDAQPEHRSEGTSKHWHFRDGGKKRSASKPGWNSSNSGIPFIHFVISIRTAKLWLPWGGWLIIDLNSGEPLMKKIFSLPFSGAGPC